MRSLARYLSLSTGTFSNWQQWRKAETATTFWGLLSRRETEESSMQCCEKAWMWLGITGLWLGL